MKSQCDIFFSLVVINYVT